MKPTHFKTLGIFLLFTFVFFSCLREDPGPEQNGTQSFTAADFDKIEATDAFDITIQQGTSFSVNARGDVRDLADLEVRSSANTLYLKYQQSRNRQYTTYLTITMPVVHAVKFYGAVNGRIVGFVDPIHRFDATLSGASIAQLELKADEVYTWLTGASIVNLTGTGKKMVADVSGASKINAFDYSADQIKLQLSGASYARVKADRQLDITASGASEVRYIGNPQIQANVTGASSVVRE
jgi:hypothetical protein